MFDKINAARKYVNLSKVEDYILTYLSCFRILSEKFGKEIAGYKHIVHQQKKGP